MHANIITERLVLREFTEADAEELHKICTQKYVLKWMPDWEMPVEELKKVIAWFQKCYANNNVVKMRIMLAVTLKEDGKMIGMVGIGPKPEVDDDVEIAYFISEEYASKGYITEAAKAMTEWALNNTEVEYLIAIVELDNPASNRIVEKCGFKRLETRMILNSGETETKPFYYYRRYRS